MCASSLNARELELLNVLARSYERDTLAREDVARAIKDDQYNPAEGSEDEDGSGSTDGFWDNNPL